MGGGSETSSSFERQVFIMCESMEPKRGTTPSPTRAAVTFGTLHETARDLLEARSTPAPTDIRLEQLLGRCCLPYRPFVTAAAEACGMMGASE